MPSIADLITQQYQRTGAPGTSTTTVTEPDMGQPLDIMSLLMMMLYSGVFGGKGGTPGVTESLGTTPVNFGNFSGAGSGFDVDTLMGMLPK